MQNTDPFLNWLKFFVVTVAVLIWLVACGGDGFASPDSTSANVPPAPQPPASASTGLSLLAGSIGGAGNLDGTAAAARFNLPDGLVSDSAGNVYVADGGNGVVRKIDPLGVVTTFAGIPGASGSNDGTIATARFFFAVAVSIDGAGNLYVLDQFNNNIRKVSTAGVVSTLAGMAGTTGSADGTGAAARFNGPSGMTIDGAGNLYVTDSENFTIRKITPAGVVSTVAGTAGVSGWADGVGTAARFGRVLGITVDASGNLYVCDTDNQTIRKITSAGVVTTLAGGVNATGSADGVGNSALFDDPAGIVSDSAGMLYVTDAANNTIRSITPAGVVSTIAGSAPAKGSADGNGASARFSEPLGIAIDASGALYVSDGFNNTIRKIATNGTVSTLAGNAGVTGSTDGPGLTAATFYTPHGITGDSAGNVYVSDTYNQTIRKITPDGVVSTLAGRPGAEGTADGIGAAARFSYASNLSGDAAGNLYVVDGNNNAIRKITPSGTVSTVAGLAGAARGFADGQGAAARFYGPVGITSDAAGNLFVADTFNSTIRQITSAGLVSTFAGTHGFEGAADGVGAAASFYDPYSVCSDSSGNLYVADTDNSTIRKIAPGAVVSTFAGTSLVFGAADGAGSAASFDHPTAIACDSKGNVYVADTNNHTVRKITPDGVVTTVIGHAGQAGLTLGALPGSLGNLGAIAVVGNQLMIVSDSAVLTTALP